MQHQPYKVKYHKHSKPVKRHTEHLGHEPEEAGCSLELFWLFALQARARSPRVLGNSQDYHKALNFFHHMDEDASIKLLRSTPLFHFPLRLCR